MKLNIAFPSTGAQKLIDIDDELKLRLFYDKRISQEVEGDALGDQFKGYVFKITGGNDKQGFAMKQGILFNGRVRLLLGKGTTGYRPRRDGQRKRKSVRGCIVGPDLAVINLVVLKKGPEELPGLTDRYLPRRLGPKRASKIRKLFNLTKQDDVRKYVIRRELPEKDGKKRGSKAPKIQRLVTPLTLQRKRHRIALKRRRAEKNRTQAAEYAKLLALKQKEHRAALVSKKRSQKLSVKLSQKSSKADSEAATEKKEKPAKKDKKETPKKAEGKAKAKKGAKTEVPKKAAPEKAKTEIPKSKPVRTDKAKANPKQPQQPPAQKKSKK